MTTPADGIELATTPNPDQPNPDQHNPDQRSHNQARRR